ncbi:Na/Pi symporter [Paenibacillus sediminis]|uniref:Phosphate:Na+ symporter n=1 Tax=Paenibacillus sediminis TaxID=664909 RepID=A0ABS4GYQ1_9BACL|nr:Na/Pi symporter [Paenibacillus sediminis]MBP1935385.1 phosphate:Na+ symporter [Paenibacillus sediminis]
MLNSIIIPLMMGLALFLLGMKIMETALHLWAGPILTQILNNSTSTPLKGMLFSTGVTAVLQSSTAITVITIGLVNAGLLTYRQTLGIILGSNIGTCLTTELIGLNMSHAADKLLYGALILWTIVVIANEYTPWRYHRYAHLIKPAQYIAIAVAGFALIMISIGWMQSIGPELESKGLFTWFLERSNQSILWGIAAGACLTAIVHSSAAVIGMAMSLTGLAAMPIDLGIAIVIGANIGTCVTALIASIGGSASGKFVAWSHVTLNLGGALVFIPFIPELQTAAAWISNEPTAQIAHAQTIFNVVCSLLALPICYLPIWKTGKQKVT